MDLALNILVRPLGTLHADLYPALCDYIFICSSRGMMDRAKEFHLWAIEVLAATHGSTSSLVDIRRNEHMTCWRCCFTRGKVRTATARPSYARSFSGLLGCAQITCRTSSSWHYVDECAMPPGLQRAVEELLRSLSIKQVDVVASWDEKARLHAL
eukprot:3915619-Rhodomonas_salina.1